MKLSPCVCVVLAFVILPVLARGAEFAVPSEEARAKALGDISREPEVFRRLLAADADFPVIAAPLPGEWLAAHREHGQSFEAFLKSGANRPDAARRVIYFLPIGQFTDMGSPSPAALREYAEAFFQMEVRVLPGYEPGADEFLPRVNDFTTYPQIHSRHVMAFLRKRLPADAYCLIGVTMTDLYPDAKWNFVFGQASLRERVGVFSFARYDPVFFGMERGADYMKSMLRRSCHTLSHEITHMFGLWHCIYYKCVINGSNSLRESDEQPLHPCVVCLRKLHEATEFDVVKRYKELEAFYKKHDMSDEAEWVARQLRKAGGAAGK
jgi:archaemetzincin